MEIDIYTVLGTVATAAVSFGLKFIFDSALERRKRKNDTIKLIQSEYTEKRKNGADRFIAEQAFMSLYGNYVPYPVIEMLYDDDNPEELFRTYLENKKYYKYDKTTKKLRYIDNMMTWVRNRPIKKFIPPIISSLVFGIITAFIGILLIQYSVPEQSRVALAYGIAISILSVVVIITGQNAADAEKAAKTILSKYFLI